MKPENDPVVIPTFIRLARNARILYFEDAHITDNGIVLGAVFKGGGRIHVFFHQLDSDIQNRISPVVVQLLEQAGRHPHDKPCVTYFADKGASICQ